QRMIAHVHVRDVKDKGPGENLGLTGIMCIWSGDGAKLLVTDIAEDPPKFETKSWIVNLKTKEKTLLDLTKSFMVTDWSRDGQWLLATMLDQNGKLKLVLRKLDGSAQQDVAVSDQPMLGKLSPDGKSVLYLANQKGKKAEKELLVQSLRQDGKADPVRISALNHEILGVAWSPDSRRIAYTCKLLPVPGQNEDTGTPTEYFLIMVNADGSNMVTVQTEKSRNATAVPLGSLDWR